jgi:hypothetical protein
MTAVATAGSAGRSASRAGLATAAVLVFLTAIGALLRLAVAGQSLFGDELSTYWIVSTHDLGGVVAVVHDEIEITPPLSFVLSWLTTRIDLTPELLRAPSLLAGVAAIPLVYLIGVRTVGRAAALVAAAITALAPFMIYYSAEARAYEPMLVLVLLSTLALMTALRDDRARWWIAYGACTCAAVYTHYTSVFGLAAQLAWVLVAFPEARRRALLANAGAVVGFLPWLGGMFNDFSSPDSRILTLLAPFTPHNVRLSVEHWSIGFPYVTPTTELRDLPGVVALLALALGLASALVALARRSFSDTARPRLDRRLALVVAMALAAPIGAALVSAVGSDLFVARNLAVSWPWFALLLAALLCGGGSRVRFAAVGLVIAGFAVSAAKTLDADVRRPDYGAAAAFVDRAASSRDVVLDHAALFVAPGPLTGLDAALRRRHQIIRVGVSEQREHNFRPGDPVLPLEEVVRRATQPSRGRIFVVSSESGFAASTDFWDQQLAPRRRLETRSFPGFIRLAVLVYADGAPIVRERASG